MFSKRQIKLVLMLLVLMSLYSKMGKAWMLQLMFQCDLSMLVYLYIV